MAVVTIQIYQDLVNSIGKTVTAGLTAAKQAVEAVRLRTYWQVGKSVIMAVARSKGKITLSEALYDQISFDLKKISGLALTGDTIYRAVQFSRNYPVFPKNSPLTFTHYKALQTLPNPKERLRFEQQAIKKKLTAAELKILILKKKTIITAGKKEKTRSIKYQRGDLYVYKALVETRIDGTKFACIDCGFKINIDFPKDNRYQPDQARPVRSIKDVAGKYAIQYYRGGEDKYYTYSAYVIEVVDVDTWDLRVDVGFGIRVIDRMRLRKIDGPEITTQDGKLAKAFIVEYLSKCPLIVCRTYKEEMYGRWLVDAFAIPGCNDPLKIAAEGVYLNQLLVDKGLAVIV